MPEIIILAEKPSQAKAYSECFKTTRREGYYDVYPDSIFPNGAKITYAVGHLYELKEPHEYDERYKKWDLETLPILPKQYEFKVKKDTKKQYEIVRSLLKNATEIIIATDPDREGQNIANNLIDQIGVSHIPSKRLWVNSLEKNEILRGFKDLKNSDQFIPLYHEAQSRQIGDWLVGLNASRLFSLLLQQKGINESFSVGRVQTPSLYLIYERQKQIDDFKPKPFYELEADFQTDSGTYQGKLKERFDTKEEVQSLLKSRNINQKNVIAKIQDIIHTTKKKEPPRLHSLSSLQSLVNKKYKYSPTEVLKIIQKLYDSPLTLVSYPRTDTNFITTNEFNYLRDHLSDYKQLMNVDFEPKTLEPQSRFVDNSKVQEHYALIPTKVIPTKETLERLTIQEKNIYFEILTSTLAMFHHDFVYEETEIITNVNDLLFFTKGTTEKKRGWKELFKEEEKNGNKEKQIIPIVNINDVCDSSLNIKEGKTTAPKPFTEGQLINVMKYCGRYIDDQDEEVIGILNEIQGIGTEATRSGIIETLKRQNYIQINKNIVNVTKKGIILCKAVEGTLLSKPELTAQWEHYLKKIGAKEGKKDVFIDNVSTFVKKLIKDISSKPIPIENEINAMQMENTVSKCPTCKDGFIVDKGKFYGCTAYKEGCEQKFSKKILGKNISKKHIKDLCEKKKTNKIKGFKGKKTFDAFLVFEKGKVQFSFK